MRDLMSNQEFMPETVLYSLAKKVDTEYNNYINSPNDDPPNSDYWDAVTDFMDAWRGLSSKIDPVFKAMNLDLAVLKWNERMIDFDSNDSPDPVPNGDYWNCQKVATDTILKWPGLYSVSLQPPSIQYLYSNGQSDMAIAVAWGLEDVLDVRREIMQPGSVIKDDYKSPNERDRLDKRAKIEHWIENGLNKIPEGKDFTAEDAGEPEYIPGDGNVPNSVEECYAAQAEPSWTSAVTGVPSEDVIEIYNALEGIDSQDEPFDDDSDLGKHLQQLSYEELLIKASEMNIVLRGRKPNIDTLRRKIVEASSSDG
jgi:hypothetical protein